MHDDIGLHKRQDDRWLALAVLIALLAFGTLLAPSGELWNGFSVTIDLIPKSELIAPETALAEADAILAEIEANRDAYGGEMAYRHMNRLYYLDYHLPMLQGADAPLLHKAHVRIERGKRESVVARSIGTREHRDEVFRVFGTLRDSDPDSWLNMRRRSDHHFNWALIPKHFAKRYPLSVAFGFLFFVCMLMWHDRLVEEFAEYLVFRIAAASIAWPLAMWWFPHRFLVEHVRRGLVWVRYALSGGLALAPGMLAKAQPQPEKPARADALSAAVVPAAPPDRSLAVDLFGDSRHDRQIFARGHRGNLAFINQYRWSADGTSAIARFTGGFTRKFGKARLTAVAGPQLDLKGGKHKGVAFANLALPWRGRTFLFLNNVTFGSDGRRNAYADRHIMDVRGSPLPAWASIDFEALRSSNGKWTEFFIGPRISLGGLLRTKKLSSVSLYPHWDASKGNFDVRVWLSFSFAH